MSAILLPGGAVPAAGVRARPARRRDPRLGLCVLLAVVLLEVAVRFFPDALLLHPWQKTVAFKQVSGYTMVALMAFAMAFGWVRRLPALAHHQARLNETHQFAGLLILLLLASHLVQAPVGFLAWVFHAMAVAVGAGALRAVLGPRAGPKGSMLLLAMHIGLCCAVAAAALVHLYLVYAYTS